MGELPRKLPNDVRLRILEKEEILRLFTWVLLIKWSFNSWFLIRNSQIWTRRFKLVTRGFKLVTCEVELVNRIFELTTCGFELALSNLNPCFQAFKLQLVTCNSQLVFYHITKQISRAWVPRKVEAWEYFNYWVTNTEYFNYWVTNTVIKIQALKEFKSTWKTARF